MIFWKKLVGVPFSRTAHNDIYICIYTYIYIYPPILGGCLGVPGAFGLCAALDVHIQCMDMHGLALVYLGGCLGVPGAFGLWAALDVHGYARARTSIF